MSIGAKHWALAQTVEGGSSPKIVLFFLADWIIGDDQVECWPSVETLAFETGMNRQTIMKATAALERQGLIEKRVEWSGLRKRVFYRLCGFDPVEWKKSTRPQCPNSRTSEIVDVRNPGCTKSRTSEISYHGGTKSHTTDGTKNRTSDGTKFRTGTGNNRDIQETTGNSLSPLAPASDDHAPSTAVDGELFPELQDYGPRMRCEPEKVRQLYNQILPELPECQILSKTRRTHIEARFRQLAKEEGFTTSKEVLDGFRIFFEGVKRSDFLMGRKDPGIGRTRAFRADLDWLMKESNFIKVCEGKYMNSNS